MAKQKDAAVKKSAAKKQKDEKIEFHEPEVIKPEVVSSDISTEVRSTATTPMTLIDKLMSSGGEVDIDKMEKLFELNLRYEENEAKKAYYAAVAAFKGESIEILKDKKVSFGTTEYKHATLGKVVETVTPFLAKHGLGHSWSIDQADDKIKVTCILAHLAGFSTSVNMSAGKDTSGKKNDIQEIASSVTYLQRYTFLAVTGLAAKDADDDGQGSEGEDEPIDTISDSQIMDLEGLIAEVKADEEKFFEYLTIVTKHPITIVGEIPAEHYALAVKCLENKRVKAELDK